MGDDLYNRKLADLQQYIPLMESMIAQLKDPQMKQRESQLSKMEALYQMITDRNKKWKYDTLLKCEEVIRKLQTKVGTTKPTFPLKPHVPSDILRNESVPNGSPLDRSVDNIISALKFNTARAKLNKMQNEETPKSPSPTPDVGLPHEPRIIPVEPTIQESARKFKNLIDPNELSASWLSADLKQERYTKERPDIYSNAAKSLTKKTSIFDRLGPVVKEPQKPLLTDDDLAMLGSGDEPVVAAGKSTDSKLELKLIDLNLKITPRIVPVPSSTPKSPRLECANEKATAKKEDKTSPKKQTEEKAKTKPVKVAATEACDIFGSLLSSIDNKILEDSKKKDKKKDEVKHAKEHKDDRHHKVRKDHEKKDGKDHHRHKEKREKDKKENKSEKEDKKLNFDGVKDGEKDTHKAQPESVGESLEIKLDIASISTNKPPRLADKYNPKPKPKQSDDLFVAPCPTYDSVSKPNRDPRRRSPPLSTTFVPPKSTQDSISLPQHQQPSTMRPAHVLMRRNSSIVEGDVPLSPEIPPSPYQSTFPQTQPEGLFGAASHYDHGTIRPGADSYGRGVPQLDANRFEPPRGLFDRTPRFEPPIEPPRGLFEPPVRSFEMPGGSFNLAGSFDRNFDRTVGNFDRPIRNFEPPTRSFDAVRNFDVPARNFEAPIRTFESPRGFDSYGSRAQFEPHRNFEQRFNNFEPPMKNHFEPSGRFESEVIQGSRLLPPVNRPPLIQQRPDVPPLMNIRTGFESNNFMSPDMFHPARGDVPPRRSFNPFEPLDGEKEKESLQIGPPTEAQRRDFGTIGGRRPNRDRFDRSRPRERDRQCGYGRDRRLDSTTSRERDTSREDQDQKRKDSLERKAEGEKEKRKVSPERKEIKDPRLRRDSLDTKNQRRDSVEKKLESEVAPSAFDSLYSSSPKIPTKGSIQNFKIPKKPRPPEEPKTETKKSEDEKRTDEKDPKVEIVKEPSKLEDSDDDRPLRFRLKRNGRSKKNVLTDDDSDNEALSKTPTNTTLETKHKTLQVRSRLTKMKRTEGDVQNIDEATKSEAEVEKLESSSKKLEDNSVQIEDTSKEQDLDDLVEETKTSKEGDEKLVTDVKNDVLTPNKLEGEKIIPESTDDKHKINEDPNIVEAETADHHPTPDKQKTTSVEEISPRRSLRNRPRIDYANLTSTSESPKSHSSESTGDVQNFEDKLPAPRRRTRRGKEKPAKPDVLADVKDEILEKSETSAPKEESLDKSETNAPKEEDQVKQRKVTEAHKGTDLGDRLQEIGAKPGPSKENDEPEKQLQLDKVRAELLAKSKSLSVGDEAVIEFILKNLSKIKKIMKEDTGEDEEGSKSTVESEKLEESKDVTVKTDNEAIHDEIKPKSDEIPLANDEIQPMKDSAESSKRQVLTEEEEEAKPKREEIEADAKDKEDETVVKKEEDDDCKTKGEEDKPSCKRLEEEIVESGKELISKLLEPEEIESSPSRAKPKRKGNRKINRSPRIRVVTRSKAKKSPSKKARRSELDKLHDDIKEMLMGEEIMSTSGKRACTIQKEDLEDSPSRESRKPETNTNPTDEATALNVKIVIDKCDVDRISSDLPVLTNAQDVSPNSFDEPPVLEKMIEEPEKRRLVRKRKLVSKWASGIIQKKARRRMLQSDDDANREIDLERANLELDPLMSIQEHDKSYYFTRSERIPCKLCLYRDKAIVRHYVSKHPESEVLISRIEPSIAEELIKDSVDNKTKYDVESLAVAAPTRKSTFRCPFCLVYYRDATWEFQHDHLSSHTGEYRFSCSFCSYRSSVAKNVRHHLTMKHSKSPDGKIKILHSAPPTADHVYAFLCSVCNFVQLNKATVEEHAMVFHPGTPHIHKINAGALAADKETANSEARGETPTKNANRDNLADCIDAVARGTHDAKQIPAAVRELNVFDLISQMEKDDESRHDDDSDGLNFGDDMFEDLGDVAENDNSRSEELFDANSRKRPSDLDVFARLKEKKDPKESTREKPIELAAFMCDADLVIEEEEGLEEKRRKKMQEINDSTKHARTSIADKLQMKLDCEELIQAKETDVLGPLETAAPDPPSIEFAALPSLPPLQKLKKPEKLEATTFTKMIDVMPQRKENVSVSKTINRLQEKLLPPLVQPRENAALANILEIGPIRIVRKTNALTYSCKIPHCVFNTESERVFATHCSVTHRDFVHVFETDGRCDACNVKIEYDGPFVSVFDVYTHMRTSHGSFFDGVVDDASDEIDESPNAADVPAFAFKLPHEVPNVLPQDEESAGSKFPFVIISVQSLAEPSKDRNPPTTMNELQPAEASAPSPLTQPILNVAAPSTAPALTKPSTAKASKPTSQLPVISSVTSLAHRSAEKMAASKMAKAQSSAPATDDKASTTRVVLKDIPLLEDEKTSRKSAEAKKRLLQPAVIRNLYKCPKYTCFYSSASAIDLRKHLSFHANLANSLVRCLYCDYKVTYEHYIIHLEVRHGHCLYGCPHCFYRASCAYFVKMHVVANHAGAALIHRVLKLSAIPMASRATTDYPVPRLKELITFYKCEADGFELCGFKSAFFDQYYKHLEERHKVRDREVAFWNKWVQRGVGLFQCAYCKVNANSYGDMGKHQAAVHFQRSCLFYYKHPRLHGVDLTPYGLSSIHLIKLPEQLNLYNSIIKNIRGSIGANLVPESLVSESTSPSPAPQRERTGDQTLLSAVEDNQTSLFEPEITVYPAGSKTDDDYGYSLDEIDPLSLDNVDERGADPVVIDLDKESETSQEGDPFAEIPHVALEESKESSEEPSADEGAMPSTQLELAGADLYKCRCGKALEKFDAFKNHLVFCAKAKPFQCVHCMQEKKSVVALVQHYKEHGKKRFKCSLCLFKHWQSDGVRVHMRNVHSVTAITVLPALALPKNSNEEKVEFVLRPKTVRTIPDINVKAAAGNAESAAAEAKLVFGPHEMAMLPRQPIYQASVRCAICGYETKVKSNMERHLQMHAKQSAVPGSAPVNPVPCLEKSEKMFDKMVNLALSSHTGPGGRMGSGTKSENGMKVENVPAFVPHSSRFVCGAKNCKYQCLEESMLKRHLMAFHAQETTYRCVHCNVNTLEDKTLNVEAVLKHLKLHDTHLYQCSSCQFMHNLRHKVERHLVDRHPEKQPALLIIIRELVKEGEIDATQQEKEKETKAWRCGICKFKSSDVSDVRAHAVTKHNVDAKYKCALCPARSDDAGDFTNHFNTDHEGQKVDFIVSYYNEEEVKTQQRLEESDFNTTPLWQRNKTVKHIRGILLDEATPRSYGSKKKQLKLKRADNDEDFELEPVSSEAKRRPRAKSVTPMKGALGVISESPNKSEGDIEFIQFDDPIFIVDGDEATKSRKVARLASRRKSSIGSLSEFLNISAPKPRKRKSTPIDELQSQISTVEEKISILKEKGMRVGTKLGIAKSNSSLDSSSAECVDLENFEEPPASAKKKSRIEDEPKEIVEINRAQEITVSSEISKIKILNFDQIPSSTAIRDPNVEPSNWNAVDKSSTAEPPPKLDSLPKTSSRSIEKPKEMTWEETPIDLDSLNQILGNNQSLDDVNSSFLDEEQEESLDKLIIDEDISSQTGADLDELIKVATDLEKDKYELEDNDSEIIANIISSLEDDPVVGKQEQIFEDLNNVRIELAKVLEANEPGRPFQRSAKLNAATMITMSSKPETAKPKAKARAPRSKTASPAKKKPKATTTAPRKQVRGIKLVDMSKLLESVESVPANEKIETVKGAARKRRKLDLTLKDIGKMTKGELLEGNFIGTYGPYGTPWDGRYKCSLCEKFMSTSEKEFTHHLYKELQCGLYQCSTCPYNTPTQDGIKEHVTSEHGEFTEQSYTSLPLDRQIEGWIHKLITFQTRILHLEKEERKATNQPGTTKDIQCVFNTNDVKFYCTFCEYGCNYMSDMRKHEARHVQVKPFKCGYCKYDSLTKMGVMKHIRRIHGKPILVIEEDVSNGIVIQPYLKQYSNPGKQASTSSGVAQSPSTSSSNGAKEPLKCYYCEYRGSIEDQVTHTQSAHPNDVERIFRYKCNHCQKNFVTLVTLNDHFFSDHAGLERSFTSVDPPKVKKGKYQCTRCDERENELADMKAHLRTHYSPYRCYFCNCGYSSWRGVIDHCEERHPTEKKLYRYMMTVDEEISEELAICAAANAGEGKNARKRKMECDDVPGESESSTGRSVLVISTPLGDENTVVIDD